MNSLSLSSWGNLNRTLIQKTVCILFLYSCNRIMILAQGLRINTRHKMLTIPTRCFRFHRQKWRFSRPKNFIGTFWRRMRRSMSWMDAVTGRRYSRGIWSTFWKCLDRHRWMLSRFHHTNAILSLIKTACLTALYSTSTNQNYSINKWQSTTTCRP